ncbi:hypothetical protein BST92_00385 [Nonlabens arenilitoris]|uniref:YbbR-like domain-containing protein n=1 Tax=Nonlabens arenilitoris TaxID=1217969 RepID=A0A2S7U646_9FLAO|nr:hypothetical protein [Nonlabens arenilitoris]PQJ30489.1 hypothetical protein BST92_00385 [Nonlabens arenilitoris]
MGSLKNQLAYDFKVGYISEELMTIEVNEFIAKKVGLKSKIKVTYEHNYLPIVSPYFTPDSVLITGNDAMIKSINTLEINYADITVQDTVFKKRININEQYPDIKVEPTHVDYMIKSAVMTEGSFTIPVNIINNKNDIATKIIPSEVEVIFNCRLQDYELIKESDFNVVIDYNSLTEDYNLVTTDVEVLSDRVNSVRFSPQQIQILVMR